MSAITPLGSCADSEWILVPRVLRRRNTVSEFVAATPALLGWGLHPPRRSPWVRRDRRMSRRKQSPVGASRLTRPPPCPVCRAPCASARHCMAAGGLLHADGVLAAPACAPALAAGDPARRVIRLEPGRRMAPRQARPTTSSGVAAVTADLSVVFSIF